jgi:flagellar hook-associated protein 2
MASVEKASMQTSTIMKSLDVGSGVDIESLARNLANAESAARLNVTKQRLATVESQMSGYSIVSSFLSDIRQNFVGLQNVSELFSQSVMSSDNSRMPASLIGDAEPGQYTVLVQQLATSTAIKSAAFAASDSSLNNGAAFDVGIQIEGATLSTITVSDDTPAGLAAAINAADIGVSATLINKSASGDDWHIVLQGQSGSGADVTVASSTAAVDIGLTDTASRLTSAQDALITVNGVADIARSSNRIVDVIPGVQLDIRSDPGQSVAIVVERSGQPVKDKLKVLVDSYNQFNVVLDELSREPSDDTDEYAGVLKRDQQFVNTLRTQLRSLLTQSSATPENGIASLRDLGLTFALDGKAEINQQQLELALSTKPDAVAQMLSAGTNDASDYGTSAKGLAQDISIQLKTLLGPGGVISQRKLSGDTQIAVYESDLEKLELRLEAVYERYIAQFASMESLVQRMEGVGKYLKGQFTAMENMYKN